MPQNAFFLQTCDLLISPKTMQRHFLFTLHPLSTVIFATATVLAFVLLCNSDFNFHCYTQREATPTQKLARKCAATSRDFFRERLQSAFTLANQLRWIAQYLSINSQRCDGGGGGGGKQGVVVMVIWLLWRGVQPTVLGQWVLWVNSHCDCVAGWPPGTA